MGIWYALSGVSNAQTQGNNAARKAKAIKSAQAAKAAGRGKRSIGGNNATAKKSRGW